MAAMKRAEIPQEERRDFYLYLDEFQTLRPKVLLQFYQKPESIV